MTPTRVTVLGDGAMGTACALVLAAQPASHAVTLWSARADNGRLLQQHRENIHLLPGVKIPPQVRLTMNLEEALLGAELLVAAIPMVYLRATLAPLAGHFRGSQAPIVSVIKGIEVETFRRASEILVELLGPRPVAVMSGPGHAEEIVRGQPTSLVVASADLELARRVQQLFSSARFRLYTNSDVLGVELGGALKNVIAIGAGVCDGLGFGDNAKAALITRALVEMIRFGVAHGAQKGTFFGLAGIGDLITTCVSRHGRNRWVGEEIGKGRALAEILASTAKVAEGVYTAKSIYPRAQKLGLDMPLSTEVYRMLYEGKPPPRAVEDLMARDLKSEL
jgi:glycerol-3-phosphate dehydrogenase (NAD(P)+)